MERNYFSFTTIHYISKFIKSTILRFRSAFPGCVFEDAWLENLFLEQFLRELEKVLRDGSDLNYEILQQLKRHILAYIDLKASQWTIKARKA